MTAKISVLLPVFNGADYIREAVGSILAQTYPDFELIVIDDGSHDDSAAIVAGIPDPRIRLIRQGNMGLAATLNKGISLAEGAYIARHDHDDVSDPQRLEKQYKFMESNPDCALLGTWSLIQENGEVIRRRHEFPCDNDTLRFELIFNNPFVHSSVMMRKSAVVSVGGYTTDPQRQPPEDYELWSRLSGRFKIANLPEYLVTYRSVPTSICNTMSFSDKVARISAENLARVIGLQAPNEYCLNIINLVHGNSSDVHGDFHLMRGLRLLGTAMRNIHAGARNESLERRCRWYKWRLLRGWMAYRYPGTEKLISVARQVRHRLG